MCTFDLLLTDNTPEVDTTQHRTTEQEKEDSAASEAVSGGPMTTRFGPADAPFEFKIKKCHIYSFSEINPPPEVKKKSSQEGLTCVTQTGAVPTVAAPPDIADITPTVESSALPSRPQGQD